MRTRFSHSSLLILCLSVGILSATAFSFYKFSFKKDFTLFMKIPCDSHKENCFVHKCEDWDSRCSESADNLFSYKILIKMQKNIKECFGENCEKLKCEDGEEDCQEFYCSPENLELFELEDVCSSDL